MNKFYKSLADLLSHKRKLSYSMTVLAASEGCAPVDLHEGSHPRFKLIYGIVSVKRNLVQFPLCAIEM